MKPFFTKADCEIPVLEYGDKRPWQWIHIDKANRLLSERGKVVYGPFKAEQAFSGPEMTGGWFPQYHLRTNSSDKALLINIEPIEQDSAEKILKVLVEEYPGHELSNRAKALLAKEKK